MCVAATEEIRTRRCECLTTSFRDGLGNADCVVLPATCDGVSTTRTIPGVKSGSTVEGRPAVGSAGVGGCDGDGDGLGGDAWGGLADGEVSGDDSSVVGGVDIAGGGCIDG